MRARATRTTRRTATAATTSRSTTSRSPTTRAPSGSTASPPSPRRRPSDLSRFNLDLEGLKVSEVKVGGQPAKFTQEGDHELVITPAAPLAKGRPFTAVVTYGGVPTTIDDASLGRSGWQISSTGGAFAAGQPHSATTWFPANDTPRDKAALKVAARVPDGWTAISNGLEGPATRDGGWTTFNWSEETPLATYLATVAIDKFEVVRSTAAERHAGGRRVRPRHVRRQEADPVPGAGDPRVPGDEVRPVPAARGGQHLGRRPDRVLAGDPDQADLRRVGGPGDGRARERPPVVRRLGVDRRTGPTSA